MSQPHQSPNIRLPNSNVPRWEHFPHDADIGIRGFGSTIAEAFEQAALALIAVVTDPQKIKTQKAIEISCDANDPELLLVDWLNALVYTMATDGMLFGKFEVAIQDGHLRAKAHGEAINVEFHEPAVEVKGATLTALSVKQAHSGVWTAQCVVDV